MKTIEQALQLIQINEDSNILEVACGCGEFSIAASKYANEVECIDLVDSRLNTDIIHCSNVHFQKMDATCMNYEDNLFNMVVMYNAAMHLQEVMESVLKECFRVLKQNGELAIISSFSMDKPLIKERITKILDAQGFDYILIEDKKFMYLNVKKTFSVKRAR